VKRAGRDRRHLLARMTPSAAFVVDIGADHGHVAHAVGAIATERLPHRAGRPDVPWVIANGLRPFRDVDVAIVAGMGALTICGILDEVPKPRAVVLHCPDDPPKLRLWLARNGWRIEAEGLAAEANRFAEVIRAVPGTERSSGLALEYGPCLPRDPLWRDHLEQLMGHWQTIQRDTQGRDDSAHRNAQRRVDWLRAQRS
jgi:tRNA A22 N-methylase